MTDEEALQLNPISLAFLGDAVYTLFVRERLVSAHDLRSGGLHVMAASFVRASGQACALDAISDGLTEDECAVARRARNAHSASHPKNADPADYKKATAFEAVLGYLEITGRRERLIELMARGMSACENQNTKGTVQK